MRVRLSTARRWGRRKKRLKQKARSLADPSAYTGVAEEARNPKTLAVAGLLLSVIGFGFWPAAAVGVLCGHVALARAGRREPRRIAETALLLGYAALALRAAYTLFG